MSRLLHDRTFKWIPADDDSTAFRERQLSRLRTAQGVHDFRAFTKNGQSAKVDNVQPLRKKA